MKLLLEIGAEEIPDWMIAGALDYLGTSITDLLKNNQLGEAVVRTDATPRRLVIRGEGIIARQPDAEDRVWGPAKNAPAQAIAGFAKKQGLTPEQLEIRSDGKAEKYSCVRKIEGRAASTILGENLPQLILKTPFPKTMYWTGKG
ncbi:MAG TPA: glycine--tRNA ligase subunit beta, partial [Bryobacteraceae bacterium]|nr:glycine--tRNA ligase subunit beta [Bryobacteraceae bacterium]